MPEKVKIAVRMADRTRRLYTVDAVAGMTTDDMRAITLLEVPGSQTVLVTVPRPAPFLVDGPRSAA